MASMTEEHGAFMAPDNSSSEALYELFDRITSARKRYGHFASTHEALGVAVEEWDELRDAIKSNRMICVRRECIDLAAVLLRLAIDVERQDTAKRSTK